METQNLTTELFDMKKIINQGKFDAEYIIKAINNKDITKYAYRTTNENLTYLNQMDLKDKKVLCVGGSGDQYLECVLYDPEEIELFDINLLSYYYIALKTTGLKVLSLNDYQKYFLIGKYNKTILCNEYFDYSIYLKIRKYLNEEVKIFWDYMYQYESRRLFGISEETIFFNNYYLIECIGKLRYLQEYKKTQKLLENKPLPKFYIEDLQTLVTIINKKYDRIITSNIDDYIGNPWITFVRTKLNKILNEKGMVQTCYNWCVQFNIPHDFELLELDSTRNSDKESTLIYRKK